MSTPIASLPQPQDAGGANEDDRYIQEVINEIKMNDVVPGPAATSAPPPSIPPQVTPQYPPQYQPQQPPPPPPPQQVQQVYSPQPPQPQPHPYPPQAVGPRQLAPFPPASTSVVGKITQSAEVRAAVVAAVVAFVVFSPYGEAFVDGLAERTPLRDHRFAARCLVTGGLTYVVLEGLKRI